jgi:hypothetical protein
MSLAHLVTTSPNVGSLTATVGDVGTDRLSLSDDEREQRIKDLGEQMTACMDSATQHGNEYFFWRGCADALRLEMQDLIRQRGAEFVAKLELERGLR